MLLRTGLIMTLLLSPPMSMAAGEIASPMKTAPGVTAENGMEFVQIPGGCFRMGSRSGDSDERPEHEVCLEDFYMGKFEVTQKEWRRVMKENPSRFNRCGDNCPVEQVSWNDIDEFLRRLNGTFGGKYRLPTEAEWEYACSGGGKDEKYCGGNELGTIAWFNSNSGNCTHTVGEKKANIFDIYDMSGNVWEWVQDWKGSYRPGRQENPKGPPVSSTRVRRGGSWQYGPEQSGRSWRSSGYPDDRAMDIGFRLAHPAGEKPSRFE